MNTIHLKAFADELMKLAAPFSPTFGPVTKPKPSAPKSPKPPVAIKGAVTKPMRTSAMGRKMQFTTLPSRTPRAPDPATGKARWSMPSRENPKVRPLPAGSMATPKGAGGRPVVMTPQSSGAKGADAAARTQAMYKRHGYGSRP